MTNASIEVPQKLLEALESYDTSTRDARAHRIAWASSRVEMPQLISGRMVPLRLLEEARVCYVNGQYIATVLSALAFVEHALTEELEEKSIPRKSETFAEAIAVAKANNLLPKAALEQADRLRKARNSFAHKGADSGKHSLFERFRSGNVHPDAVLEEDAKAAVNLMYEVFSLTLRPGT